MLNQFDHRSQSYLGFNVETELVIRNKIYKLLSV